METHLFIKNESIQWVKMAEGIQRKILGYDDNLMVVAVDFKKDAVAPVHSHPHKQSSYIASGVFDVEINGEKKILKQGDGFFIPPDIKHGVTCLEEGRVIDSFTPAREDFLK